MTSTNNGHPHHDRYAIGDEVTGTFRCSTCDLLIVSPTESDGILVLPDCPLCHSETWRRVGAVSR